MPRKPRGIIKFLCSDAEVYLCPYCMHHIPGVVPVCPDCGRELGKNLDIRTTEGYRKSQEKAGKE